MYGFGSYLSDLRTKKGLSEADLAVATGIPVEKIRRWESGKSIPTEKNVLKISQALNIDYDELWEQIEHIYTAQLENWKIKHLLDFLKKKKKIFIISLIFIFVGLIICCFINRQSSIFNNFSYKDFDTFNILLVIVIFDFIFRYTIDSSSGYEMTMNILIFTGLLNYTFFSLYSVIEYVSNGFTNLRLETLFNLAALIILIEYNSLRKPRSFRLNY